MDEQSYIDQIDQHVATGNYHAAINIAISGMNAHRKENNQAGIDKFLGIINSVSKAIAIEFGSKHYLEKLN